MKKDTQETTKAKIKATRANLQAAARVKREEERKKMRQSIRSIFKD